MSQNVRNYMFAFLQTGITGAALVLLISSCLYWSGIPDWITLLYTLTFMFAYCLGCSEFLTSIEEGKYA